MTQNIGNRIRSLREKHGLTRSQLAKALGLTFQAIFNWEEAGRVPRVDTLTRLAEVLGVSTHYLMTGKEDNDAHSPSRAQGLGTMKDLLPPLPPPTMDALLKKAQLDFAAAMGLPPAQVRVTVEVITGPATAEVSRRK